MINIDDKNSQLRSYGMLAEQLTDAVDALEESTAPGESCFAEVLLQSSNGQEDQTPQSPASTMIPYVSQSVVLDLQPESARLSPASAQRLVRLLWDAIRRGQNSLEIKLRPNHLGDLKIRITLQGNQVHLDALAAEPRVVELLLSNQQELRQGLSRWGLVLGRFHAHCVELDQAKVLPTALTEGTCNLLSAAEPRRSFIKVVA